MIKGSVGPSAQIRAAIDRFLESAKKPALVEPGEQSIDLAGGSLVLEERPQGLLLQAWDERRNLVRRIVGIESTSRGRLELRFERFGKKTGTLALVDLQHGARERLDLHTSRLEFREQFRRFLRRNFPAYRIATLSTEPNLEESLSPAYARALLREGASAWAAIGAGPDCLNVDGILSFGLIWLDYLRRQERTLTVHGLILLLPYGSHKTTCLRLRHLSPAAAAFRAFAYAEDGAEAPLDLADYGNLDTHLEAVHRRVPGGADRLAVPLLSNPAVEVIELPGGELSYRVRGLEFARTAGDSLEGGLETKHLITASNVPGIERLAARVAHLRSADARDKLNPIYLRGRELWLESQVRAHLEQIDASLLPSPIYGQSPTFAAGERGIIDLLAAGCDGRLSILELKASQDVHLPLQALDYWMRVNWHLERNEFEPAGYFPGIRLRKEPPRIILVAPALDFHPSNECVLRYFSPDIAVERVGVGACWQRELKIMFRM